MEEGGGEGRHGRSCEQSRPRINQIATRKVFFRQNAQWSEKIVQNTSFEPIALSYLFIIHHVLNTNILIYILVANWTNRYRFASCATGVPPVPKWIEQIMSILVANALVMRKALVQKNSENGCGGQPPPGCLIELERLTSQKSHCNFLRKNRVPGGICRTCHKLPGVPPMGPAELPIFCLVRNTKRNPGNILK